MKDKIFFEKMRDYGNVQNKVSVERLIDGDIWKRFALLLGGLWVNRL